MATRLERLWVLLDSGSTPVTRKTAAIQIGEIQKLHPHELNNLLKKVCTYLNSKSWETRIAAGQAVEAIAANVKLWDPTFHPKHESALEGEEQREEDQSPPEREELLSLSTFDFKQVLKHGTPLLSSTGDEYQALENDTEFQKMTPQERLSFQRQQLKQRLGLSAQGKVFSTGMENLFDDNDLVTHVVPSMGTGPDNRKGNGNKIRELSVLQLSGMSARERNKAKRKARQMARRASTDTDIGRGECDSPPPVKKPKMASVVVEQSGGPSSNKVLIDQVADVESPFEESEEWPFRWFCEEMFQNLFNPAWEIRHGAGTALREVIKLHGKTAGISIHTLPQNREETNQGWLVDAAVRLLCVFSLDKFADFVSDQVVAPVRATCAQALGIVARLMSRDYVIQVAEVLLLLASESQWEVRHASLMGMQYLLAARKDLSSVLLPSLFPCILRELQDVDDDVRAVAAGALLPVSSDLSTLLPDMVPNLLQSLWDSLLDLDDLSSSTNSIMELMGTLLTSAPTRQTLSIQDPLSADKVHSGSAKMHNLVPRLWPFLSHTICSVRKFSLRALLILLDLNDSRSPSANDMVTVASSNNQEVEVQGGGGWLRMVLQSLLCQLFQRFALEGEEDNRQLLHKVWACVVSKSRSEDLSVCVSPVISAWLCLLVASSSSPVETNLLVPPNNKSQVSSNLYLGGSLGVESHMKKDQAAFMARVAGTKALGLLASKLSSPPPDNSTSVRDASPSEVINILLSGLQRLLSNCLALHKIVAALVVYHWNQCPSESLRSTLLNMLMDATGLEELTPYILAMQKDCQSLIVAFDQKGVDVAGNVNPSGYSAEFATRLATSVYQETVQTLKLSPTEVQEFETLSRNVLTSVGQLQEEHQRLSMRVNSCIAGSLVSLVCLPEKLNPIVRPLMDCIKMEADGVMQQLAASWLSQLVDICQKRVPSPNSKIIKNLCSSACCDPRHTPRVFPPEAKLGGSLPSKAGKRAQTPTLPGNGNQEGSDWKWNRGIISLVKLQKEAQSVTKWSHGRGRLSAAYKEAMATAILEEERRKSVVCQQRGAEMALNSFCKHFGEKLFTALPHLWLQISQSLENLPEDEEDPTSETVSSAQSVINSLQILEIISLSLATPLHSQVLSLLPCLLQGLHSPFTAIRHMAARGMCSLAQVDLHHTMQFVVSEVLPFLETSSSVVHRQGAIEALSCILEGVGLGGLCYVVLFLMPVLGRMSDQDHEVQLMASRCFASLVTLMPLESGATPPPEMSPELVNQRQTDRQFLEQLLDTSKLENYVVPVPIKADLRKYQQDGINWLAFLNKYKLHGILCDDMGLGKTLQSLCLIAGDHHNRSKEYEATGHMNVMPLPSLVICPPTLTGHWFYEVKKFCDPDDLDPLQYSGSPSTRAKLQTLVPKYNLIIASYDIVRNDIDFFKTITWNYCVLDEGHVIKNTKTKITRAVKQLQANHRLILSGTPIQNNVLELWSLFDFLLPGFLGTEKQFYERFGKPIIQSRDAKSSSKEQEAGALAMESLHRQVLPFLLRRMKEDVLQDLPPKIIQDYHCDLSPLQVQLYEDFAKSHAQRKVEEGLSEDVGEEKGEQQGEGVTHIFQALQYLRKVCNHPALVVNPEHPLFSKVQDYLSKDGSNIKDIKHAAKLQALRQLLWDCGIGDVGSDEEEGAGMTAAVSQHRALIFCQYKSMLDIIENTLLKAHMPSVTYLRLDGSIAAANRFEIVNKFNSDPSVDVFLLTTHVGGLGLNLTGADTVIFFEHDWNPMKDLQAMDRTHRIGQKKVVNVYRLITRGTLEEKIMSLQKFKLNIANTVIGQDNSSLRSMNTSDLLDLFQVSGSQQQRKEKNKDGAGSTRGGGAEGGGSGGMKKVLENLPELWDDQQYSNEYDLSGFMKSLTAVEK